MQVIVDGMRVRVRLDQQRISSLLAGISPESMGGQFADVASGVLSMLGDMASLSFAGYHTGKRQYASNKRTCLLSFPRCHYA